MAVPTSSVSFSQLRAEYRYGFNTPIALPSIPLNDASLRAYIFSPGPLPAVAAKPIADTRGVAIATFSVATNTVSYDVRGALVGLGAVGGGAAWTSASGGRATTFVNVIGGVVFSTPGVLNYAFDTGAPWPATSSTNISTPGTIFINARGGPGGAGGSTGGPTVPAATWTAGGAGTNGGTALRATIPLVASGGVLVRGGGGGGGGGAGRRVGPLTTATGGGGGGGGASGDNTPPGGTGGTGTYTGGTVINGQNGQPGSFTGGGTGGQNTPQPTTTRAGIGGNGGSHGAAGQSGTLGALPGTQGPGAGAGGAGGSSITGFSLVTGIPAANRLGPTVP